MIRSPPGLRKVLWPAALTIGFLVFLGSLLGGSPGAIDHGQPDVAALSIELTDSGTFSALTAPPVLPENVSVVTDIDNGTDRSALSAVSSVTFDCDSICGEKATATTSTKVSIGNEVDDDGTYALYDAQVQPFRPMALGITGQNVSIDNTLSLVIVLSSIVAIALLITAFVRTMHDMKSNPSTLGGSFASVLSGWTHLSTTHGDNTRATGVSLDTRGRMFMTRFGGGTAHASSIGRGFAILASVGIMVIAALTTSTRSAFAGDAGLLPGSSGSIWALFALVGVVTIAFLGLAIVKVARR